MQFIAKDFAERFDAITQYLVKRFDINDLCVINNRKKKKFLQECLDDLHKCKSLRDFIHLKNQHYAAANGYECLKSFNHSSSWQKQLLRHLQKYLYFSVYDNLFVEY